MRNINTQCIYGLNSEKTPEALISQNQCFRQHVGIINSLAHIHQFELQPNDPLYINENATGLPNKAGTLPRNCTGITPTQEAPAMTGMS